MKEKIKSWFKNNWFKLLAIGFLLGALGHHQYGYYQFLRWIVAGSGAYLVYLSYNLKKQVWLWIFAGIALLFNPIIPFHFQRETWQFVDIIVAIIFFIAIFKMKNDKL